MRKRSFCVILLLLCFTVGFSFSQDNKIHWTEENQAEELVLSSESYPVVYDEYGNIDLERTLALANGLADEVVLATESYPIVYDEYGNIDLERTLALANGSADEVVLATESYPIVYDIYGNIDFGRTLQFFKKNNVN